jgi:5'-nucleotidase/UDP-sugar diphosphatase
MAARQTLLTQLRNQAAQKNQHVLLLSGGDINTGTFESDVQRAEPDFKAMKRLAYDAMAVGNHEWDHPLPVIRQQQAWAAFPFLSANTRFVDTQKRVFDPYTIVCLPKQDPDCPVKIGILGLTTTETARTVMPKAIEGIVLTNPVVEAKQVVEELNKQDVDIIIAVTHMGHDGPIKSLGGQNLYYDVQLAQEVPELDVIVGGHTQVALQKPIKVGDTLIVQAKDWGRYVGHLQVSYRLQASDAIRTKLDYALIPVNPFEKKTIDGQTTYVLPKGVDRIEENTDMLAFLKTYNDKADVQGDEVVGALSKKMDGSRDLVRSQFTPIGHWVANVVRKRTNSDFAMVNSGGLRDSLPQGEVTKRMVHQVHPFGNTLVSASFTPEQVLAYIQQGLSNVWQARQEQKMEVPNFKGAFPQWAGVQVVTRAGEIQSIRSTGKQPPWLIEVNEGKVVASSKEMYQVGTVNFVAQGGDGYATLTAYPNYLDSGLPLGFALMQDMEEHSPLDVQAIERRLAEQPPLVEKSISIQ